MARFRIGNGSTPQALRTGTASWRLECFRQGRHERGGVQATLVYLTSIGGSSQGSWAGVELDEV